MINSVFKQFNQDNTVLTPNQRLTATLLKKYNYCQSQEGKSAWPSPDLLPLSSWTQRLWDNYLSQEMDSSTLLLSANQELILWEEIITASPESEQLLQLSELAKQAKSAWATLKKWRTDFQHPAFALTENSRAFQAWALQFETRCQQEHWVDSASLIDLLIEKIQRQQVPLPRHLLLLNFTEITPQQRELLKACEVQGVEISYQKLGSEQERESSVHTISLSDTEEELQTMARWAKTILDREPQATIGCIASALEEKRDSIIAIFSATFGGEESFNISAGKTLASYPIIQAALQLLLLPFSQVSFEALSQLFHSPYLGDAEKEMLNRIQVDNSFRRQNRMLTPWEKVCEITQTQACPRLTARLQAFLVLRKKQPSLQNISQWVHHFAQALETLGWPGEQSLNSAEYQVVKCWLSILKETAAFDLVLPPVSASKALHYLTALASKTFFQPQTPEAPIQILGQLEGAGIPFDYLWITGMDDKAWPPAPNPSPFIPHELQKRLQMPLANAERQLQYSLKMTEQFKEAAPTVIFSYAQQRENEELRLSPLLTDLAPLSREQVELAPFTSFMESVFAAQELETLEDELATPLATAKLQGGTSIFAMQAACPFKAFAKWRLQANALEEPEPGLPAKNRGTIVHRVLELLWKELGTQQALLGLEPESLRQRIQTYLSGALKELAPFLPQDSIYLALVTERLEKLILDWLELEKNRPPFRVLAQEQETTLELQAAKIKLRVDRIDELADGAKLIIDYKTKKNCNIQDWFGERPTEPQLPLYCISNPGYASGLAFAQLHARNLELKGLAEKELNISGLKTFGEKTKADAPSWAGQLEQWRIRLTQLLQDFQEGKAEVDPKDLQTCHHCDLQALCRIHELDSFREAP